ncbi:biliverdin-producing heme oxygenase [Pseudomonas sp. 148P]|uniref:Biliverdin-producing heme oxygenase n=1 Tax=Pseudomonas ulcerans TaxID=3115852 RepID=A0ABU7HPZ0_9PSED|nr:MULTISPECIES: biliverdin-producing heme oxygenase [unclassified Pseudomonas]MEE1922631.1 biliverdin-producing heme oxygenase [Pseudomonas sp. 147P]MEE1933608.1 biliverdin-producing heme oxygenase [Pseudomonas sp. 148P]
MQPTSFDVASASVLQALRASTGELHIALEKRLPFFSDTLDIPAFRLLMQAYHGFYAPLEAALQQAAGLSADFDLQPRYKTAILRGDLQALGLSAARLADLPACTELPRLDSAAACLGVLYVVEGATLGGQVLRREIQARLGLDASNGAAFLDVYGADTGRRWRAFLVHLCSRPLDAAECAVVVAAAQQTFRCFERWLESREVLL